LARGEPETPPRFFQDPGIDAFIKDRMATFDIAGVDACLVKNDRMVWSNTYGSADLERQIPMNLDWVQNILLDIEDIHHHGADAALGAGSFSVGNPKVSLADWIEGYLKPGGQFYDPKENYQAWKPGDRWEYNDVAFGLLAYLVER
jgi:CubicO group peptidase (beta-lactamase class C family)